MNHEPGPSTTQSAASIAFSASGAAGGSGGTRVIESMIPSVVATSTWPRTAVERIGVAGHQAAHLRGDVHGDQGHRQHPAGRAEQPADVVESVDVVAEQLPEADDEQVADHVVAHLAVAGEAVLQHPRPGDAPLVAAAERGQRHPQVAGRQYAELAAEPARRAAVVGDGDDRGQVVDHELVDEQPQRRQRGVQPVAAAERDHRHRPVHHAAITPAPGRGGRPGPRCRGPGAGGPPPRSR